MVNVTVVAVLAKDAPGIDRQSAYPVDEPLELAFISEGRTVVKAVPLVPWKQLQKGENGSFVYGGSVMITHADLQRMARSQKLAITDNFSNAIRDLSISTNLSGKRLSGGAELLVKTRSTK